MGDDKSRRRKRRFRREEPQGDTEKEAESYGAHGMDRKRMRRGGGDVWAGMSAEFGGRQ